MADASHDIATLNDLLATVIDSVDGFGQASQAADTGRFKAIFDEVAADRRGLAGEIEGQIRALGGTPDDEGTILGSAHRVLIRLRDALSNGDTAVVDEAERGEDHIKAKFAKAADDQQLSPAVQNFVATAAERVRRGHDRISELKHALHAAD